MAGTISFDGLATGINATETVDKLIAVAGRPKTLKEAEKARYENQKAAWTEVSTKATSLRDAVKNLWKSSSWANIKVSSTNSGVMTATAGYGAKDGTYTFSVEQLALNSQQASKTYDAQSTLIGAGTLSVTVGTTTTNLAVTAADTVTTLAQKVNAAKLGATASIIKDGSQYRLLISADKTGVENKVTLGGDVAASLGLSTLQAAQDAKIKFGTDDPGNGVTAMTFTSTSNKVDGVVEGVTLNLVSASPGEQITLSTSRDTSAVEDKIQSFVDAYNDTVGYMNTLTDYDTEKKVGGVLLGDSTARQVADKLRSLISGTSLESGAFRTLRSIGVDLQDDGTLKLDTEKLSTALAEDYSAVETFFRDASKGLASKMDEYLKKVTQPIEGISDRRVAALTNTIEDTQEFIEALDDRLKAKRDSLMEQFVKMESMVKSFNGQSGFLSSQLSGLNKNWG